MTRSATRNAASNNRTAAPASAPTGQVNSVANNKQSKSTSKNPTRPSDTAIDQVSPQENPPRPARGMARKPPIDKPPTSKPAPAPTSRKRRTDQEDHPPPPAVPGAPELEPGLNEQPPNKKLKTKAPKGTTALASPTGAKKGNSKTKTTSKESQQANKENVPPTPATAASNTKKKPTAADRREWQMTETDNEALERRIKELEAENAKQRLDVERLQRKNKRLDQQAAQLAASTTHSKPDQMINEPEETTYNLQNAMGLEEDYRTYARIQKTVRDLARRVLDFNQPWKHQDPIVLGDLFRAAAEKESYLTRFRQNWATSRLVQMYLRNTRSYNANIDIPGSGVARRRAATTVKGAIEAGLPIPDLSKKKKPTTSNASTSTARKTANSSVPAPNPQKKKQLSNPPNYSPEGNLPNNHSNDEDGSEDEDKSEEDGDEDYGDGEGIIEGEDGGGTGGLYEDDYPDSPRDVDSDNDGESSTGCANE